MHGIKFKPGTKIVLLLGLVLVIIASVILLRHQTDRFDPVPLDIRKSVNFTIYYPNPKRLPVGYTLATSSFSYGNHALVYYVGYGNNQRLLFSEQHKPSAAVINNLNNNILALHRTLNTPVGVATIGALGKQTVVSLPTIGTTWILITGPYLTPQNKLNQVLQTL